MAITKEQLKAEIDKIEEADLGVLYRIVLALEATGNRQGQVQGESGSNRAEWHSFIAQTYGSSSDSPISRGDQGPMETRESLR